MQLKKMNRPDAVEDGGLSVGSVVGRSAWSRPRGLT